MIDPNDRKAWNAYLGMFAGWQRDGKLAYPTWPERLFFLARSEPLEAVLSLLRFWFSPPEVDALGVFLPLAGTATWPEFQRRLEDAVVAAPERYPEILRPRVSDRSRADASRLRLADLLAGKRVVLVGPSTSLADSGSGRLIDDFDVVVRMNAQWPVPPSIQNDFGQRIDVLYHTCNGDCDLGSLFQARLARHARFVCFESNPESGRLEAYCEREGVPRLDVTSVYEELLRAIGAYPNTGTVAIAHLLRHDLEELHLTGLSFYQDPYHDAYRGLGREDYDALRSGRSTRIGIHEIPQQLEWFERLRRNEPRLHLDDRLARIVRCG